jgi:hypothetical protein
MSGRCLQGLTQTSSERFDQHSDAHEHWLTSDPDIKSGGRISDRIPASGRQGVAMKHRSDHYRPTDSVLARASGITVLSWGIMVLMVVVLIPPLREDWHYYRTFGCSARWWGYGLALGIPGWLLLGETIRLAQILGIRQTTLGRAYTAARALSWGLLGIVLGGVLLINTQMSGQLRPCLLVINDGTQVMECSCTQTEW